MHRNHKDIPPTSCQKFWDRSSIWPLSSPLPFSSRPICLCLRTSICIHLCLRLLLDSFLSLPVPEITIFNIPLQLFLDTSPLLLSHSSPKHSPSLCLCARELKHKLSAHSGLLAKDHWSGSPTRPQAPHRRDFPAVFQWGCVLTGVSPSLQGDHAFPHVLIALNVFAGSCFCMHSKELF